SPLIARLADAAKAAPLAALFIDYGHTETAWGDTLQAVRGHKAEHPLASPGEADLSLAVDFAAFRRMAEDAGFAVDGPVRQADFLGQLGIVERASHLMASNSSRSNEIESGVYRLMSETGMGSRFHVIAVRTSGLPPLPGLEAGNFAKRHT
ncbi:MAG: SAM-dependent methyltransferase, partial [Alphaproteobacteria bacterium]|nr:SAM-dependent methyltransferase [Alphaproteobacteria bacterium]